MIHIKNVLKVGNLAQKELRKLTTKKIMKGSLRDLHRWSGLQTLIVLVIFDLLGPWSRRGLPAAVRQHLVEDEHTKQAEEPHHNNVFRVIFKGGSTYFIPFGPLFWFFGALEVEVPLMILRQTQEWSFGQHLESKVNVSYMLEVT